MNQPFHRGDLVICNLSHLTVKAGQKVRVVKCERGESGSGWLVTATSSIRGRMPANPSIAVSGVDSAWFAPSNTASTRLGAGTADPVDETVAPSG